MAWLKLPMKITILISLLFLLSIKRSFGMLQTGTCRPICTGSDCITINRDIVDFKTAESACHDRNGELMTFQLEADEGILLTLSQELFGNFWIGLRLPAGACSNLSAPLRGYEWTAGSLRRNLIPAFGAWKDNVKVCSPHCVSLSSDRKWTERLCSDKTDGFLCRTKHKDACQARDLSDPHFFSSSEGCSTGPCEHKCTDVKGGYKCSCFTGYIPDSENPRQCTMYCEHSRCPAICQGNACDCPKGFVKNDKFCEDMDECTMDACAQKCENTFGGFVCSCYEGFVLKDQVKCFVNSTPPAAGFVKPPHHNNTQNISSASTGGFLWIWILITVIVVVFIFVLRLYLVKCQKRREQLLNQQSSTTAPVENIEC